MLVLRLIDTRPFQCALCGSVVGVEVAYYRAAWIIFLGYAVRSFYHFGVLQHTSL